MFSRKSGKLNRTKPVVSQDATPVFSSVHVDVERIGPALYVLVKDEHITEREAGILYDETDAQIDERCTAIVLDFSQVTMLASAGIGTLVRLHKRIGERKGSLAVCAMSEDLAELFKLTRMDKLITVKPDRVTALAGLTP